jgi:hypothetical protein
MTALRRALEPRTDAPNIASGAPAPAAQTQQAAIKNDDFPLSPTPTWSANDSQQEIPLFPMPHDERLSGILEFDVP